ncbi:MAG: Calx-beta domain-containing protein [Candidatus Uhrbacteria bacterium]
MPIIAKNITKRWWTSAHRDAFIAFFGIAGLAFIFASAHGTKTLAYVDGQSLYVGGDFTTVGDASNSRGVPLEVAAAQAWYRFPVVNDTVRSVVTDGSGGWFIGGDFTAVGGVARGHLAHIKSDGTVDSNWRVDVDGSVYALARNGLVLYVGGEFTTVGGSPRNNLAAVAIMSAAVWSWDPNADGSVYALALGDSFEHGTTVYAGGNFGFIGVAARNRLAAIIAVGEAEEGNITNWDPNADGVVYAIATTNTYIFVGGDFTNVDGASHAYIAALRPANGEIDSAWLGSVNGIVRAIAANNSFLFVGGDFLNAGWQPRLHLAAFQMPAGILVDWLQPPNPNGSVFALTISGDTVYIGGDFTSMGGVARNRIAAIAGTMGDVQDWNPNANGVVRALAVETILPPPSPLPSVSFGSATSAGSEFNSAVTIPVKLFVPAPLPVTIEWSITGGTATADDYFPPAAGTVAFAVGEQNKLINLLIKDDVIGEQNETLVLTLANPVNATLGEQSSHTRTIEDNDGGVLPTVAFSVATSNVSEDEGAITLPLVLSVPAPVQGASVGYMVTGGTATRDGTDHNLADGMVSFAAGSRNASISFTITNDELDEPDETIIVELVDPLVGATMGNPSTHILTIQDDDVAGGIPPPPPSGGGPSVPSVNPVTSLPEAQFMVPSSNVPELEATVTVPVALSSALDKVVTVDWAITGGTATAGEDYQSSPNGTLTFSSGQSEAAITIGIRGDLVDETDEDIIVSLANPQGVTLGVRSTHVITIADNDDGITFALGQTNGTSQDTGEEAAPPASNAPEIVVAAQVNPKELVTVVVDGTPQGSARGDDHGRVKFDLGPLPEGPHHIEMRTSSGAVTSSDIIIDRTAPDAPKIKQFNFSVSRESKDGQYPTMVELVGTLPDKEVTARTAIVIIVSSEPMKRVIVPNLSEWQFSEKFLLELGSHEATISALDAAGNESSAQTFAFTVSPPRIMVRARTAITETIVAVRAFRDNPKVQSANQTIVAPAVAVVAVANTAAVAASTGVGALMIYHYLASFFTEAFFLVSRRRRRPWGIVYDSLAKRPIDLALIRLHEATAGKLIASRVTDREGRYAFLPEAGEYRLEASHQRYVFPSRLLAGKQDDPVIGPIVGEGPITVAERHGAVVVNVPMDPREQPGSTDTILRAARRARAHQSFAYIGPALAVVSAVISPTVIVLGLVVLHLLLFLFFRRVAVGRKPKSFGLVRDARTRQPIARAIVRIFDAQFHKLLEAQVTGRSGQYGFLVGRGRFELTIEHPAYAPLRTDIIDRTASGGAITEDLRIEPKQ